MVLHRKSGLVAPTLPLWWLPALNPDLHRDLITLPLRSNFLITCLFHLRSVDNRDTWTFCDLTLENAPTSGLLLLCLFLLLCLCECSFPCFHLAPPSLPSSHYIDPLTVLTIPISLHFLASYPYCKFTTCISSDSTVYIYLFTFEIVFSLTCLPNLTGTKTTAFLLMSVWSWHVVGIQYTSAKETNE